MSYLLEDGLQEPLLRLRVNLRQVTALVSTPLLSSVPAHCQVSHLVTRVRVTSGGPRVIRAEMNPCYEMKTEEK